VGNYLKVVFSCGPLLVLKVDGMSGEIRKATIFAIRGVEVYSIFCLVAAIVA
jgi:hypothetical protein